MLQLCSSLPITFLLYTFILTNIIIEINIGSCEEQYDNAISQNSASYCMRPLALDYWKNMKMHSLYILKILNFSYCFNAKRHSLSSITASGRILQLGPVEGWILMKRGKICLKKMALSLSGKGLFSSAV